jgi:hypothetical protein
VRRHGLQAGDVGVRPFEQLAHERTVTHAIDGTRGAVVDGRIGLLEPIEERVGRLARLRAYYSCYCSYVLIRIEILVLSSSAVAVVYAYVYDGDRNIGQNARR